MSDVIKPENECPFDPKHYQCDCFIAPVGSFSWALIQLKLRKRVTRSAWKNCQGNNEMYLAITPRVNELTVEKDSAYAVDGVAVGIQYDYLTHIDLRNEHGNFVPWQPTQEDMMACDWGFVEEKKEEPVKPETKPEPEYMLVLDVIPEKTTLGTNITEWGDHTNKALVTIENNIVKGKDVSVVEWVEDTNEPSEGTFRINMTQLSVNKNFLTSVTDKKLTVKIDEVEYHLGSRTEESAYYAPHYKGSDAEKIGELLKQQLGRKLRLHLNWHN